MASFKVPCPSCENTVLIKNEKLIGTKVECPKCKYRFKVEEPSSDKDAKKGDKKGDAKKAAGGKNKKLVPILVGVGAVILLAVVAFVAFGGKKTPKFVTPPTGSSTPTPPDGDGNKPEDKKDDPTKKEWPPGVEPSKANTTNLLPGQSVAVYRFNMDRLRESPAHAALVDGQIRTLFRDSMGFEVDEVETYIHCVVGEKERDGFGVVRLKNPVKTADLVAGMRGRIEPKPKAVKKQNIYGIQSNPFVAAVSHAMAMRSLLGGIYDRVPGDPAPVAKPLGLCVYDTQHILVGDRATLEKFLGELDDGGNPPFKSVLAGGPPPGPGQAFATIDAYRTIEVQLKKSLDTLEADKTTTPLFVYAEKFDAKQFDPKLLKKDYPVLKDTLVPIAERTTYVSANVTRFSLQQLVANVRIKFQQDIDAQAIAKEHLGPRLTEVTDMLRLMLTLTAQNIPFLIEFRNFAEGPNPNAGIPMVPGGMPLGPEGMPLGPMGFPMGPGPVLPGPMRPMGEGAGAMALQPPGPMGFPMGMGEDPNVNPMPFPLTISHIDLGRTDDQLIIGVDLTWSDTAFRTIIAPRLVSVTNQIKGKMAVFATGDYAWQTLAAAVPKMVEQRKSFPPGTHRRPGNADRFGLAYPPSSRVSLFADLLPYMGRGGLEKSLTKNAAWYDEKNLPAPGNDRAGAWVPELLVPDYPQSAWRATSPLAPDHVLGATNYVAIAGSGLNIARAVDPTTGLLYETDPVRKADIEKKLGITGYDWSSKPEDVKDGLSNTIYMMQTPPGLQQPWIAGGGATVRGLDENDPMGTFKYSRLGGTKMGSYALMGDGSVRFIPADIDPKVLLGMSTRAGGETLGDINKHTQKVEVPKPEAEAKVEPMPPTPKKDDKADDKKPADPKKPEDKKELDPKAKGEAAPAPGEKKDK